jgi:hypothetical protein
MRLPEGFEALEPFVAIWAGETAVARDALRTDQSAEARQAFYDAMTPLIVPALDHLDATSLSSHDAAETALMRLALTYAHIAHAIEVQGPDEAKHAANRQHLHITRTPADVP